MNHFYINIAAHIGNDFNDIKYTNVTNFVSDSISQFKNHQSTKVILDSFNKCNFKFECIDFKTMYDVISSLDKTKATGYDGISSKILKTSISVLYIPLTNLFNKCIKTCIFPRQLKCANVTPIFKKENPLMKKNYRPVSILTSVSKIFEKIIALQLQNFQNTVYHPYISAFRKQHSCQSVLLRLTEDWRYALDSGRYIGTVLMDLSKAFDSVPISLLISKLHAYSMHKNAIHLIASYLTNRSQRVKISNVYSNWVFLEKSVPQGSVLGSSLFNIFINDIYGFIKKADLFNYADDNTLAYISNNVQEIEQVLTAESNVAINWFYINMMEANPDKFQVMFLSKKEMEKPFSITLNGNTLKSDTCVKLLGVYIDNHLNFKYHTDQICQKASRQLNALCRIHKILDSDSKMAIIRSFIISNVNYCPVIWHFCGRKATNKMECILKRALRMASHDYVNDYSTLLNKSGLSSLELQRQKCIAMELFKIKNNMAPAYLGDLVQGTNMPYNTRSKLGLNLTVPYCKNNKFWSALIQILCCKNMEFASCCI